MSTVNAHLTWSEPTSKQWPLLRLVIAVTAAMATAADRDT